MSQQYRKVIEYLISGVKESTHREMTVAAYERFIADDEEVLKEIPLHCCALLTHDVYHKKLQYDFVRRESLQFPELKKRLDASSCIQLEDYFSAVVIFDQLGGYSNLDSFYKFLYVNCLNSMGRYCSELTKKEIMQIAADLRNHREVVFDLAYNSIFSEMGISQYEEILSEMVKISVDDGMRKISSQDLEIISKSIHHDPNFFIGRDKQTKWVDVSPYINLNPSPSVMLIKESMMDRKSNQMNTVAVNQEGFRKYSIHELRQLDERYSGVEVENR